MQAEAVLGGRYRLEGVAGAGGMGTVYRAVDAATGGACAVKVLASDASARARERFVTEAAVLAKVSHPAVVRYLDHGDDPPYLVMEWVDGESLAERLARGGATPEQALRLGERLLGALAAVHAIGVVHRDVKPRNIMLPRGAFEAAKIVDFGVARALDVGSTGTGVRIGTPRYMAPEQIVSARRVDGRVDVFSLGCVLFEMITGRKAFRGRDEVALLARMVIEDAPRVRSIRADVSDEIDELVARLLARDRRRRPWATEDLAGELGRAASRLGGAPPAASPSESESEPTENTPDELTLFASLTPLPPPSELPWPTIGRDDELAAIAGTLQPDAIVGLWGALGVGKSHVAQALARDASRVRGAIVADLRGAASDEIARRVGAEIGVLHAASVDDVCAAIAARGGLLVILDGCDGASGEILPLAKRIVAEAPKATVLLVSRERPPLPRAFELAPLPLASAAELFVARARGAASLPRDRETLETIARDLHGNPLALTLAASRASLIGLDAIASRLARPLEALGSAKAPAYPVSLREAVEGVWDALPPAERRVAIACAIFPGPMRPEIAAAVAAALTSDAAALDGLESLREKSLSRPGARGTLVLDPALRELARERMAEMERGDEGAAIAAAKRTYARETVARAPGPEMLGALALFEADLLAAFEWAASAGDAEIALGAALALEPTLVARGPLDRLAWLLDRAVAMDQPGSLALARAHAARGRVASLRREADVARRSFDDALRLAAGDAELEASIWLDLGVMHQARGDFAAAERCYATVLEHSEADASRSEARARGNLGALAHDRGDLDAAYTHYVRAIAVAETIGDPRLLGVFLGNLAVLDRERGRAAAARQRFLRALHALEDARDRRLVGITLGNLGMLELVERRTAAALAAFERSAETLAALGDAYSEALAQARLGAALAVSGKTAAAEAAVARAERLASRDETTLAIVRFFRAFPETARAREGGETADAFAERARARIDAAQVLARTNDDVRAALRVLVDYERG